MHIILIILIAIVVVVFILMFGLLFIASFFKSIFSSIAKKVKREDDICSFCGHHSMKIYKIESGYKKICKRCKFSVEIKDDKNDTATE